MVRSVLILGVVGGVLVALLRWVEYRFLIVEYSGSIYGGLIAAIFAGVGIWLGIKLTHRQAVATAPVAMEAAGGVRLDEAPASFVPNETKREEAGITRREMEVLTLVARGLSNREIAGTLFVSENTVKTHCSRAFDKLGARRRTEAVQRGKEMGLLP